MMSWLRSWCSPAPRAARRPSRPTLRVEPLEGRVVPAGVLAFGTGAGVPGRVALFHDQNNDGVPDGSAYATLAVFGSFTGGVRVAVGDFVGDSHLEVAVASGPGTAARVILFPLDASDVPTGAFERFFPFGSGFTAG